jgi:transcriptional regulator with XRE-family HTH domain
VIERPATALADCIGASRGPRESDDSEERVGDRVMPHVRKAVGQQLRVLRKARGLSQERLSEKAAVSARFIGEVERGQTSISVDSLYRLSVALRFPLARLAQVREPSDILAEEAEKIAALVASRRRSDLRVAYEVLRALLQAD